MNSGKLYLVATPIGNLKDITFRAIETLKNVDWVLCEDTRYSGKLFQKYRISTSRLSFHEFNKKKKTPGIIRELKKGRDFALISNAGTPGISDPGFYLVREALKEGIEVISIPGPSAFLSGLIVSGLPTDRFVFEGFLPRKAGRRRKRLEQLKTESRTIILYESPYRIERTLEEILSLLGEREICVIREITKIHEQVIRDSVSGILERIQSKQLPLKGEFMLILRGR